MMKSLIFFAVVLVASSSAGVLPFASYAVAPFASSYSAHAINHAVATPVVAHAPVVAAAPLVAPAPLVAAAPLAAAPAPFVAAPALAPYSAYPYASYIG